MLHVSRRQFLQTAGAGAAALAFSHLAARTAHAQPVGHQLPALPYAYDALEPYIDAETMKIHHDLHHKAYVDNLNKALAKYPDLAKKPTVQVLRDIASVPQDIRQVVINNGGGHANHSLFWQIMGPKASGQPKGELVKAIEEAFGSVEKLQQDLSQAAITRFGSGWGWLVVEGGKLKILSTGNQDSPLMKGQTPILGLDVWEHAYYLKYRNRRPEYVKAWWNVVNWDQVANRYNNAKKQG